MAELRYNPVSRDWVMVASHRQSRPQMPKDWCPFCAGSGRVPDEGFDVLRYPNDYPALSTDPPEPDDVVGGLFRTAPAYGRCEVLLYSDQHNATLKELSDAQIHKLAVMWRDVYQDMSADLQIRCVYIFENRGDVVGVTMPHPHGQAYGYSFIPKKLQEELEGSQIHYTQTGRCIFCDLLSQELDDGRRILFENDSFVVYVPFFSPITYGATIIPRRHVANLGQLTEKELFLLGETVRGCSGMYDTLFDMPFPYMMCMYNAPVDAASDAFYHFHIKFFPPMRDAARQQFFASSETGMGAWCNPNSPEEKAKELRNAYQRYIKNV